MAWILGGLSKTKVPVKTNESARDECYLYLPSWRITYGVVRRGVHVVSIVPPYREERQGLRRARKNSIENRIGLVSHEGGVSMLLGDDVRGFAR